MKIGDVRQEFVVEKEVETEEDTEDQSTEHDNEQPAKKARLEGHRVAVPDAVRSELIKTVEHAMTYMLHAHALFTCSTSQVLRVATKPTDRARLPRAHQD